MRALSRLWRLWEILGWQTCLAILLTALSASAVVMEISSLQWVQWFGAVGGFISTWTTRNASWGGIAVPLILGLVANVGFLTVVFVVGSWVVRRFFRKAAFEN